MIDALTAFGLFFQTRLGVAFFTLALSWLVGSQISAYWARRQKRRELETAAADELHALYGEFLAIWKLWNRRGVWPQVERGMRCADLMARTTVMEGRFEALLLQLTSRFSWSKEELDDLGLMRQIFQFPRSQIERNEDIPWRDSEHPQYMAFKRVSTYVGARLTQSGIGSWRRYIKKNTACFIHVTMNIPHETNFDELGEE